MTTEQLYSSLMNKGYEAVKAYYALKDPEDNYLNILSDRRSMLKKASVAYFNMAFDVKAFEELVKE